MKQTEEEQQKIIEYYLAPHSINDTVKQFHIHKETIHKILEAHNVECHAKQITDKIKTEKSKATNLQIYGVEFPIQLQEFQDKRKQTCLEKFGVEFPMQNEEFKAKTLATNIEKYGNKCTLHDNGEIEEKVRQTNLEKYGVEQAFASKEIQEKSKQSMIEHFGVPYAMQSKEVQEKSKQTNLEKYGVEFVGQNKDIQEKAKQTCFEKYGCYHVPTQRYIYNNISFDSFPELCFYLYCIAQNLSVIREPKSFEYLDEDNNIHYYTPDFEVNDKLYEIKGSQFLNEGGTWQCPYNHALDKLFELKHKCALENNIIILYSSDYQKYIDWFEQNKYNKNDFILKSDN